MRAYLLSTALFLLASASFSEEMEIGRPFNSSTSSFIGHIDELRVWSTELSNTQINIWQNKAVDQTHTSWESLRGYYQFNGTGTAVIDSGKYGSNGALKGDLSFNNRIPSDLFTPATLSEKCLALRRSDYFTAPTSSFTALNGFTLEIWYKADYISGDYVIFSTNDPASGFLIKRKGSTGELVIEGQLAAGTYSVLPPNGKWNHIAFSFKGSEIDKNNGQITCYINGKSYINKTDVSLETFSLANYIFVGINPDGISDGLQGQVKEFRLWSTAVDEANILNWFRKPVTSSHPQYANLKTYYSMNNTDAPLTDESGSNNNGTLNGQQSTVNFMTDAPKKAVPGNVTPEGFDTRWQPVIGSDKFHVDVSTSPTFGNTIDSWDNRSLTGTAPTTVNYGLSENTKLYYRVRSGDATSANSEITTVELAERSVNFNGSSYGSILQESDLDFAVNDFSVEFWMKSGNIGSWPVMMANKSWSYAPAGWLIGGKDGKIIINISDGATNTNLESTVNVFDDKWYHIAVTCDRDGLMTLYINGENNATTSIDTIKSVTGSVGKIYLGRSNTSGQYFYTGKLDEVRFWNRQISANEVKANLHCTLTGIESGLFAYYRLNNSEGTTLADSAGYHDGTFTSTQNGDTIIAPVGNSRPIQQAQDISALWQQSSSTTSGNSTFSATINDLSFTVMGHDNDAGLSNSALPTTLKQRLEREWTLYTNGSSSSSITFDLDDLGLYPNVFATMHSASSYKLIVKSDSGNYSEVPGTPVIDVQNHTITFNAINLTDGKLTLATTEESFTGQSKLTSSIETNQDGSVNVSWQFSNEAGINGYSIYRSLDGKTWTKLTDITINVAQNGSYLFVDNEAVEGALYKVTVNGSDGSTISSTTDAVGSLLLTYTFDLDQGWNLISMPCIATDLSELKNRIKGNLWGWSKDNFYSRAKTPQPLQGFWVYCEQAATNITIKGQRPKSGELTLKNGWNLIGPCVETAQPDELSLIYHWENSTYQIMDNSQEKLIPMKGYWAFSQNDANVISMPLK